MNMDIVKRISQLITNCVFIDILISIIGEAVSISSPCRDDTDCGIDFCDLTTNRCMDCDIVCVDRFDQAFCEMYCPNKYKELMSSTTTHTAVLYITTVINPTPAHVINGSSIPTAPIIVGLLLLCGIVLIVGTFLFIRRKRFGGGDESTSASSISLERPIFMRQQSSSTAPMQPLLEITTANPPILAQVAQPQPGFPTQATDTLGTENDMLVPSKGQELGPGMTLLNREELLKNESVENDR